MKARHVKTIDGKLVCSLKVGDKVKTINFGIPLDDKVLTIKSVYEHPGCESGYVAIIKEYPNPLDTNWFSKVKP